MWQSHKQVGSNGLYRGLRMLSFFNKNHQMDILESGPVSHPHEALMPA